MKRMRRTLLAVAMAFVVNLVGVVLLTALKVGSSDDVGADEPEETYTEAPEVHSMPEPAAPRPRPKRSAMSPSSETVGVAGSQLPTFSTLDSPNSIPVAVDPAVQESLDTLFADLSLQPDGTAAPDALFESTGRGRGDSSGGAGREPEAALDAAEVDEAPTVRRRANLRYPLEAERDGITGYVVLRGLVERNGRVSRVDILESSPPGVFDDAAKTAFAQWTFEPGRDGGKPVRVWVRKRLEFQLR
jgi:protein TonB